MREKRRKKLAAPPVPRSLLGVSSVISARRGPHLYDPLLLAVPFSPGQSFRMHPSRYTHLFLLVHVVRFLPRNNVCPSFSHFNEHHFLLITKLIHSSLWFSLLFLSLSTNLAFNSASVSVSFFSSRL